MIPPDKPTMGATAPHLGSVSSRTLRFITCYLCFMALILCGLAYYGWSTFETETPASISAIVIIVCASGALGGLIHSCRSFYFHAIEGTVTEGRTHKYILRPFTGAVLALIFFYAIKSGFQENTINNNSLLAYAALGSLVGMFTDQAAAKLKKIAEGILTKPDK